ncbi:MAG: hypothetical protein Alpg2KO_05180 [Alphaproteobacteria bacterium]
MRKKRQRLGMSKGKRMLIGFFSLFFGILGLMFIQFYTDFTRSKTLVSQTVPVLKALAESSEAGMQAAKSSFGEGGDALHDPWGEAVEVTSKSLIFTNLGGQTCRILLRTNLKSLNVLTVGLVEQTQTQRPDAEDIKRAIDSMKILEVDDPALATGCEDETRYRVMLTVQSQ